MYSITQPATPITLMSFPRRYYFKAGFYMFFGFLAAQFVIALLAFLAFIALLAIGVFSTGVLGGLHV